MSSFVESKNGFDSKYQMKLFLDKSLIPVDGKYIENISLKGKKEFENEEYYKWQFFYSLINSGLYVKDYVGAEIYLPKGNKNSAPIKIDGVIFNQPDWLEWYGKWRKDKNQEALDWLRTHIIGVIEFKNGNSKDVETVYNQQLKSAMKETENSFCLGILYDTERMYLFQKRDGKFLRLDEGYNIRGEESTTKDLSLHLPDAYNKLPSFEQIEKRILNIKIDRSKRTIDDLDVITGIYNAQLKDGVSSILRVMDKVSMKDRRGYEILIQIMALKIFDEKRSAKVDSFLDFYKKDAPAGRCSPAS